MTLKKATERVRPGQTRRSRQFRRQDAIANDCPVYAGQLGYGPNPKLQQRIRDADLIIAVGARLGEATTDGYTLITPDHPGQTLVHVHPDPNELGRVYQADLPICADMGEFAELLDEWDEGEIAASTAARRPIASGSTGPSPSRARASRWTSGRASRRCASGSATGDHLQRRGQFLGLVAPLLALWRAAEPACADQRDDGLRPARGGRGGAPLSATGRSCAWPATATS